MNIRYAGTTIRLARKSCNMTQNDFACGVCEPSTLSRIESGTCGVSPETFHKLMSKAGIHFSVYPEFQDKNEFDVFRSLQNLSYNIDSWNFQDALQDLSFIESHNYGNNRLFYQQTQTCKAEFMLRIHVPEPSKIYEILDQIIIMDYPHFNYQNFKGIFLTYQTIHTLILMAESMISLNELDAGILLSEQLEAYIHDYNIGAEEKAQLLCKNGLAQVKCSLARKNYSHADRLCQHFTEFGAKYQAYSTLPEFYYLWSLALFYLNQPSAAKDRFDISFWSTCIFNNGYSNFLLDSIQEIPDFFPLISDSYPESSTHFTDYYHHPLFLNQVAGYRSVQEAKDSPHYRIGDIIYDTRRLQKLSLSDLSEGLCSISKLSKIEKGTLQPDCFLSESLLQRLGLPSNLFMTYASSKDFEIAELKKKMFHLASFEGKKAAMEVLDQVQTLVSPDDVINQQFITLYQSIQYTYTDKTDMDKLMQAMNMTLPNFSYEQRKHFYFTANEIAILNNMNLCQSSNPEHTSDVIMQLKSMLAAVEHLGINEKDFNRSFGVTVSLLILLLYRTKAYQEVIYYFTKCSTYFNLLDCRSYCMILSHVCQSQFELGLNKDGIFTAKAAVSMLELIANKKNAELLQQFIKEDFNILLS